MGVGRGVGSFSARAQTLGSGTLGFSVQGYTDFEFGV